MQQTQSVISNPFTFRELKEFGLTGGPAVTAYLPSEMPGGPNRRLSVRLGRIAEELAKRCAGRGISPSDCDPFLTPFREQADAIEADIQGPGLILLRSLETFRYFWLPREVEQQVVVADNFHVRPILDLMEGEKRFYVLALAQKDLRLLYLTEHSSEEVQFGDLKLHNMLDFFQTEAPENYRQATSAGASIGTSGGSTEREHKDEYLHTYFAAVNKALVEKLRDSRLPLVLAGVDYEVALYAKLNTYPHLCQSSVSGAPNSLKGGELHTRALESLEACRKQKIEALLLSHEKQAGGIADAPVRDIVKAAYEGRVSQLLIAHNGQGFGSFDEATHRVREHARPAMTDEDLLNAAAVQTVLHAGDVYVIPDEQVPGGRPAAAIMRY